MSNHAPNEARVIPLRPAAAREPSRTQAVTDAPARTPRPPVLAPHRGPAAPATPAPAGKEPLWRDLVGDVLRRERLAQERTLKDVADAARISMPYLSEVERGRKEASSEVLAAAARALGLGLTDLLSLAQRELTRHSRAVSGGGRSTAAPAPTSASRYDGMCLAA
ncbi:helix-turn-helix domain-containing protein [Streptomyces rhizosphaerihabitans]|uniref:helix-turn-helix domain-containing protein n=1 Tax=Streptomyces rhizosphaerihabitans TaxID=1266770 RepID=UPI0028F6E20F|nr:helix-turn-helix transcriptional regulator [Streptomyces rhizosphaerihabitans]